MTSLGAWCATKYFEDQDMKSVLGNPRNFREKHEASILDEKYHEHLHALSYFVSKPLPTIADNWRMRDLGAFLSAWARSESNQELTLGHLISSDASIDRAPPLTILFRSLSSVVRLNSQCADRSHVFRLAVAVEFNGMQFPGPAEYSLSQL
ncbi:hypothetical protein ARMGADRAFT_1037801 [Armillaria gallica]|uniref:Uncharacterized protein n=1 Tax=Armillaria gallica TaxID=47427 RepID=A0A2H3D820_ARMGA|nr:hypothetical protein ARMGADRAFT_1037801 [Armillaria gallica]